MGAGMDDLDNDLKRTIDDQVDDQELLPFRYQKRLDIAQDRRIVLFMEARRARGNERDNKMQLFQINRSQFITTDQQYRIQYMSFRGGDSAWIISKNKGGWFFALDHAPTLEAAKAKFQQMMVAA